MSPAQVLLLAALLLAVAALARAIGACLKELEPGAFERPWPLPLLQPLVVLIAHFAGRRLPAPWRAAQRTRLLAAGFEGPPTPPEWFAVRCLALVAALAPAVLAGAGGLRGGAPMALAAAPAALLGILAPPAWLRYRTRRRLQAIDAHLALHLEMLLAGLEAGLEWRAALRHAAQYGPAGAVQGALRRARADAASEVADALRHIDRCLQSPAAHRALGDLLHALAGGAGLRSALHAVLVREEGRHLARAEAAARWRPGVLARPLIAGTVPCLVMLWSLAAWP